MTREMSLIAKPDERNELDPEKEKGVLVGGRLKMNWVGEWMNGTLTAMWAGTDWVALSEPTSDV